MKFKLAVIGVAACTAPSIAVNAMAQNYPTKPIRIIAQFTPSTSTDILARVIGQKLSESWGQQVVIDNSREEFGRFIKAEIAKWGQAVKDSGAKAD